MFKIKRNHIIISALVVMIAVAGYLNYIDQSALRTDDAADVLLTEAGEVSALVMDDISGTGNPVEVVGANTDVIEGDDIGIAVSYEEDSVTASSDSDVTDAGVAVFVNSTSDSSYFVQAKLEREQSRAKQKETLTDMINLETMDQAQKAECASKMLEIQQRIEKESAAEAMIEAKGFTEAYVRIDENTVDVVVSKSVLSDAEIAQIEDIVTRKTGVTVDNIRITPLEQENME